MRKIKLNKRVIFILIINVLLLIIGLLYPSIINKSIISTKLTTYIEGLLNSKYSINSLMSTNILNNIFENSFIYLFSFLLISFPIVLIIYFIKIFSIGVSISSIIYIYKFKGILYSFIILLPSILSLFILSISFYYSISYFIIMIRYRKNISKKRLLKGYLKVFIITTILDIIIGVFDSYLSFYLFKFI